MAHELTQGLIVLLLAGLTALVGVLFQKFNLQKFGLTREKLVTDMRGLVLSYEEQIEAQVKAGILPATAAGQAKIEGVLAAFMQKYPKITPVEANDLAHEAIATVGVGAAGFLAKLLQATKVEAQ